jgi:RES domain-containing protein
VIYASESYAGAMLELLVHRNAQTLPKHYKTVRILIPDEIKVESVYPCDLPGWDDEDERVSKAFADAWYDSRHTPILRVPSVVTHGPEFNLVLNTLHLRFQLIQASDPVPVIGDSRLMKSRQEHLSSVASVFNCLAIWICN